MFIHPIILRQYSFYNIPNAKIEKSNLEYFIANIFEHIYVETQFYLTSLFLY